MMRVRVPNGDLSAAQLRALGEAIAPYGDEVGCADVTTRAGIQLRGIGLEDAGRVLDVLKAAGITPIQSGMDNVRQVSRKWKKAEREREKREFFSFLLLLFIFFF
jgi:ferredoxin-nitrite reductase